MRMTSVHQQHGQARRIIITTDPSSPLRISISVSTTPHSKARARPERAALGTSSSAAPPDDNTTTPKPVFGQHAE